MAEENSGSPIPELGMAAAAFACLLVVVSIERPSADLLQAVRIFAVTIPVAVAGAFVVIIRRTKERPSIRMALWILRLCCTAIGDVGCAIGVYFIFRHLSGTAARHFLTTSLMC